MNTQLATAALSLKEVSEYTNALGLTKAYTVKTEAQIKACIQNLEFEIDEKENGALVKVSKKTGEFIAAGAYLDGKLWQSLTQSEYESFKKQF